MSVDRFSENCTTKYWLSQKTTSQSRACHRYTPLRNNVCGMRRLCSFGDLSVIIIIDPSLTQQLSMCCIHYSIFPDILSERNVRKRLLIFTNSGRSITMSSSDTKDGRSTSTSPAGNLQLISTSESRFM